MTRILFLSLLLSSVACASAPPHLPVDWTEPAPLDDKPKKPAPPPKPAPPKDDTPPRGEDRSPSSGPQPVDPSPHAVIASDAVNCTARRENCRNLDRLCRNGSGRACADGRRVAGRRSMGTAGWVRLRSLRTYRKILPRKSRLA